MVMITLKDEWYVVGLYVYPFRDFWYYTICCVSAPSLHIESTDSTIYL